MPKSGQGHAVTAGVHSNTQHILGHLETQVTLRNFVTAARPADEERSGCGCDVFPQLLEESDV